jgi:hypothetical protein
MLLTVTHLVSVGCRWGETDRRNLSRCGGAESGATRKEPRGKHAARAKGVATPSARLPRHTFNPLPGVLRKRGWRCGTSSHDVPPADLFRRSVVLGSNTRRGDVPISWPRDSLYFDVSPSIEVQVGRECKKAVSGWQEFNTILCM